MVVLAPIGMALTVVSTGSDFRPATLVIAGTAIGFLVICYLISRTQHYLTAAGISLVIMPLAIFSAIVIAPVHNVDLLRYLVLGLLLCGIMFPLQTTIVTATGYLVSSLIVISLVPSLEASAALYSLIFVMISAALIVTFMRYRDLTEQDRQQVVAAARDELRVSRELYRTLAQNLPRSAVLLYDHSLKFLLVEGVAQLGYAKTALEGRAIDDVFKPENGLIEANGCRAALVGEEHSDQRQIGDQTYQAHYLPVRDDSGAITAGMILIQNITEEVAAEAALRRSEEQQRSLIELMDNLVFSLNLEGNLLVYHPMPSSIYDTPVNRHAFVGKHYQAVLPPVLAQNLETAIGIVTQNLSTQQIDYSQEIDGQTHFFSARISPMISQSLQLQGCTVVVTDVTEAVTARHRQQRLLAAEKIQRQIGMLFLETDNPDQVIDQGLELMGSFFDLSRVYLYRLRENERLLDNAYEWCAPDVSPQKENFQGIAVDELFPSLLPMLASEGIIAVETIHELPRDIFLVLDAQGAHSVLMLPFYVDQRLDGFIGFNELRHQRQWMPEEISALRTFTQSYSHVLERQKAQHSLVEARDSALHSAKVKSEFVSNMSHEIRTPMTGVIGMLDLLRETELTTDQKDFIEIAHNSANRLLTLVNDILDFSKIEAGKVALENIPMDVRGVISEVQSMLMLQASKKQLKLTTFVGEDVPARILSDPTRLRQILTNLVGNAIKFTERGSVHITVRQINSVFGRSRLRFEVIDTGIGIQANRQTEIFDSFVQADSSTTRRYGGAGLGLAICKQLISLMGGQIDLESIPGVGSTFGFTLAVPIVALPNRDSTRAEFAYLQVMVMDEENSARYLIAQQLRLWGANVIEASSPEEANDLLTASVHHGDDIDLLIFRCRKTLEEQEQLAANLRETLGVQTPLLVQVYDDEALSSPLFDRHLRRPIHPTVLYNLLAEQLDEHTGGEGLPLEARIMPSSSAARILLADDEVMNRQIVVHALEPFGYTIDLAQNGQEVLNLLALHDYQLILMDIHMPLMDGLEATRRIRALEGSKSQVPIVAITASIQKEEREHYLESGINAIIGKPFSVRELREVVELSVWRASSS